MDMILTERELELLLLIKSICEFDAENPGNIPEGGIGEIAVSNGIYEPDEYKECIQKLDQLGFVDEDDKVTTAGNNYIEGIKRLVDETLAGENKVSLSEELKHYFKKLHDFIKTDWSKCPYVSNACIVVTLISGIATIAKMF
ncbi:MAG TPA: hypothetical protein DCG10_07985 [Lachnospiraceae bacterium]|nr:hypothetical protein [Lachnospiraceae bacterium]